MAELQIPITKGKGTIVVDTELLSNEVYQEVVLQGLKVLLNRGASKVTKANYADPEELKAAAMAAGQAQLELVMTGKIKFTGSAKAKKASGVVMTEARRLARALVKDAIRAQGGKVSHYEASDITKAANALLDTDQGKEILAEAERNITERSKTPAAIDVSAIIAPSPKLVAKAEAERSAGKAQLSAKQAGKPKVRSRAEVHAN